MLSIYLPCFTNLLWSFILFQSCIDMFYISSIFSFGRFESFSYEIFLFIFQRIFFFVIKFSNLSQFADFINTFLIHHDFSFLLDLFDFFLHSNFLSNFSLHNLLWNSCINGHQSFFLLRKLLFSDWFLFEIVFLFILSEPFG